MARANTDSNEHIYTPAFWIEATDRAWKTAAGALLAAWGGDWVNFYSLGWDTTWKMTVAMVVFSLLGSVISAPVARRGTAVALPMDK